MALKEQLMADLKKAMKDKDNVWKNVVQMCRAAILQFEKDNKTTLDEQGVIEIIAKEVKKRKDVLPDYERSGREELIAEIKREIDILMSYLPKQLEESEIEDLVKEAIASVGASTMKDIGKVMAAVMPKTKGKADGKLVNEIVRKHLSGQ
ncbi:MAG: GatB/YqeY domain-containing protein [Eubacteriales bacterium]|nr:GatB/YqeY domain-containing protein [Eubacteriales bacterium]